MTTADRESPDSGVQRIGASDDQISTPLAGRSLRQFADIHGGGKTRTLRDIPGITNCG